MSLLRRGYSTPEFAVWKVIMNIKSKKAFAVLCALLLIASVLGFSLHAMLSHSSEGISHNETECMLCLLGEMFKITLPIAAILALIMLSEFKRTRESYYTPIRKPIQIPMLCWCSPYRLNNTTKGNLNNEKVNIFYSGNHFNTYLYSYGKCRDSQHNL